MVLADKYGMQYVVELCGARVRAVVVDEKIPLTAQQLTGWLALATRLGLHDLKATFMSKFEALLQVTTAVFPSSSLDVSEFLVAGGYNQVASTG
jgi:hypothetical protein